MSKANILAVASGKGGVGKTLTSVNLALSAARDGTPVALVDADPLSNVMTLLDYPVPERPLPERLDDPESQAFRVAPRFEVIFPQPKPSADETAGLIGELVGRHRPWLDGRYGLVIIDMPAGAGPDGSFPYLTAADALLLVTNPEPTAHVAAGALLRNIGAEWRDRPVFLWHNKYVARPEEEFDPDDVVGNYNRNVDASERITVPSLTPIAFVPPDPALDLTKADPPVIVDLHRSLSETLEAMADASLPPIPKTAGAKSSALIGYFLRKTDADGTPERVLTDLEAFLGRTAANSAPIALPAELRTDLLAWISAAGDSPIRRQILRAKEVLDLYIGELEARDGTFSAPKGSVSAKAVDREIVPLLKTLSCLPENSPLRRLSGLLLFRYALLKLFANESALKLISSFLPRRNEGGTAVRDRRRQIVRLIGKDAAYQERYFALVKKLYPVVGRQLDHLVSAFGLRSLLFREDDGSPAKRVYAKLFSAALYEIINSGLGVVAGFRFRPSSRAFRQGYEAVTARLAQTLPA